MSDETQRFESNKEWVTVEPDGDNDLVRITIGDEQAGDRYFTTLTPDNAYRFAAEVLRVSAKASGRDWELAAIVWAGSDGELPETKDELVPEGEKVLS
jgi:hypothetical protein